AFGHPLFSNSCATPALGSQTPQIRGGIVLNLLSHYLVWFSTANTDRVSCSGICTGRHHSQIRSEQNEEPCRGGTHSTGTNEDDHRNLAAQDLLDNLPHRGIEATGGAQSQDDGCRLFQLGLRDPLDNVLGRDRMHHVVELEFQDSCGGSTTPSQQQE